MSLPLDCPFSFSSDFLVFACVHTSFSQAPQYETNHHDDGDDFFFVSSLPLLYIWHSDHSLILPTSASKQSSFSNGHFGKLATRLRRISPSYPITKNNWWLSGSRKYITERPPCQRTRISSRLHRSHLVFYLSSSVFVFSYHHPYRILRLRHRRWLVAYNLENTSSDYGTASDSSTWHYVTGAMNEVRLTSRK